MLGWASKPSAYGIATFVGLRPVELLAASTELVVCKRDLKIECQAAAISADNAINIRYTLTALRRKMVKIVEP